MPGSTNCNERRQPHPPPTPAVRECAHSDKTVNGQGAGHASYPGLNTTCLHAPAPQSCPINMHSYYVPMENKAKYSIQRGEFQLAKQRAEHIYKDKKPKSKSKAPLAKTRETKSSVHNRLELTKHKSRVCSDGRNREKK